MKKECKALAWAWLLLFAMTSPALAGVEEVRSDLGRGGTQASDLDGDGWVNVRDVALLRGGHEGEPVSHPGRLGGETITMESPLQTPGVTEYFMVRIEANTTPLFGYSLDIDIRPEAGATGSLWADVQLTNLYESENIITAGGASLDPVFTVILDTGDGGVFISANTQDSSTVLAQAGVNDVLAQIWVRATVHATGLYTIDLGPATALSDANGFPVDYGFTPITIDVQDIVPTRTASWGAIKSLYE